MPRLLVVSFSVCPAPDRHGVELGNLLKALGPRLDVDAVTLRVGDLSYVDRFMGARMLRVPAGPKEAPLVEQAEAFRRALGRQLEGEEYDLIHLRSAWGGRAVLERATAQTRIIYEVARAVEGEPATADDNARRALEEEEAAVLARADLVFAPTETARRHLAQKERPDQPVVVLPPGVDINHFDWEPPLERDPAWMRPTPAPGARRVTRPGVAPAPTEIARIVYAGGVEPGAGIRLLVEAMRQLRSRREARLVLVGPVAAGFDAPLDRAIQQAGLVGRVERLGPVDHEDMPRVLAQATICVAPSAPDLAARPLAACPTKVLEYLACRRPVVAPRRSTVSAIARDGRDALLFAPDDATDLARQLDRLLDDSDLRSTIAESGYRHVRARYPASAVRRRLVEAYARLVPPATWLAPRSGLEPIGAMASRFDTTTGRRAELTVRAPNTLAAQAQAARADLTPTGAMTAVDPETVLHDNDLEMLADEDAAAERDATVKLERPPSPARVRHPRS